MANFWENDPIASAGGTGSDSGDWWKHDPVFSQESAQTQQEPQNDVQRAAAARLAEHPTLDRFMTGFVQPLIGGTQLVAHVLPGVDTTGPDTAARNAALSQKQAAANAGLKPDDTDWVNLAGNVASPINYMPGVGAAARGVGAATGIGARVAGSTLARGALQGAELAAYQPVVTEPGGDYAGEKAAQIGIGAGTGAAGAKALSAVGAVVKPAINPAAKKLMDEGVKPTIGQMVDKTGMLGSNIRRLEDVAAKAPLVGAWVRAAQERGIETFNIAAANRALKPIGESVGKGVKAGHELIQHVEEKLGAAYDRVHPNISARIDNGLAQDLGDIVNASRTMPAAQRDQLKAIIDTQITEKFATAGGVADGKTIQSITSELGRRSAGYAGDPSFDTRTLGHALNDVRDAISAALERQNPAEAPILKNINEGWSNFVRLRQAASSTASQARQGVFTPTQLGMAARRMDKSAGKGASARGSARMQDLAEAGRNVLPSTLADSGTPERFASGLLAGELLHAGLNPGHAALGAVLPALYSRPGQAFARAMLTRPEGAQAVRDIIRRYAPSAAARLALLNQTQP